MRVTFGGGESSAGSPSDAEAVRAAERPLSPPNGTPDTPLGERGTFGRSFATVPSAPTERRSGAIS